MITATFVVQKTLEMPQAEASEEAQAQLPTMAELEENNIIVAVKADGTVTVDGQSVTMEEVPEALEKAAEQRDNVELVLDVDDDVNHEQVVGIIDAAAGAQIERIHFVTRAPPGGGG